MRLSELQRRFVASLYGEPTDLAGTIRIDGGIGADERLAIYRGNLQAGFEKALQLEFPVVATLCGAEFFTVLAREFQRAHPSGSGDLHHIGGPFPGYLRDRFGGGEHAYFADIAALEWAREESARAMDSDTLDVGVLRDVAPDDLPALRFALHPAVRLVASRWPIFTVWEAHQGPDDVRHVDLGAGSEYVLVRRAGSGPALERLTAGAFGFLAALADGCTLGAAFDAAIAAEPDFDVTASLQRCVVRGMLCRVWR